MATRQHFSEFNVGERVEVSDGTKRPPDRHNKKLSSWKGRNFKGEVKEVHEPFPVLADGRIYAPDGYLTLSDDRWQDSWIIMQHSINLGENLKVEKIAA